MAFTMFELGVTVTALDFLAVVGDSLQNDLRTLTARDPGELSPAYSK